MAMLRVYGPRGAALVARPSEKTARKAERLAARRQLRSEGTIDCGCWYFFGRMMMWAARNGSRR